SSPVIWIQVAYCERQPHPCVRFLIFLVGQYGRLSIQELPQNSPAQNKGGMDKPHPSRLCLFFLMAAAEPRNHRREPLRRITTGNSAENFARPATTRYPAAAAARLLALPSLPAGKITTATIP